MKTKTKIIGITLAVIMLASVFVPSFALTDVTTYNAKGVGKGTVPVTAGQSTTLIIGETIDFSVTGLDIIGVSDDVLGQARGTTSTSYKTADEFDTGDEKYIWAIDVDADGLWDSANDMKISLKTATLEISIKDTAGKSIDSTTIGSPLKIDISSSLFKDDTVKLVFDGPDGEWTEVTDTTAAIDKDEAGSYEVDTTGWKAGTYDVWVKTDKDNARGVDKTSNKVQITMRKEKIEIEATNEDPAKEETVTFTVRGPPNKDFSFSTNHPEDVLMTHFEDNPLGVASGQVVAMDTVGGTFDDTTDEDGIFKFATKFTDDRTFTFKVWFDAASYDAAVTDERDSLDIDVGKIEVTIEVPTTGVIGEDVTITVLASSGDEVDIAIDDVIEFNDELLVDGEVEVEWDTTGYMPGTVKIKAFINSDLNEGSTEDEVNDEKEDEIVSIRLVYPGLDVEQPRNSVAEDDEYTIEGTATGVKAVDLVLVGPKGYNGNGLDVENGCYITSSSTTDNEFSEDIAMGGPGFDTGTWVAIVLSEGRDGGYGDTDEPDLSLVEDWDDVLDGKTQTQIVALIDDRTKSVAGSDDLMEMLSFKVVSAYLTLNPVASVGIGEPLNITGKTNREPETTITISTFSGPTDLPLGVAEVVWETADEGTFSATIDTSDAEEGTYTLEAEDGDGNTDTVTVTIGAAAPATPAPTATPAATAAPTVAPTPVVTTPTPTEAPGEEEEPTPTKEPGFEVVFAITGLLAVAYLVLRIKK